MQWVLVREICDGVRTNGNWTSKAILTANELYGDVTCSSGGDDLFTPIGIGGVLLFCGLVPGSREY